MNRNTVVLCPSCKGGIPKNKAEIVNEMERRIEFTCLDSDCSRIFERNLDSEDYFNYTPNLFKTL